MNFATELLALAKEIPLLIQQNISPDGCCRFDPIKVKLALELVKFEIQETSGKEQDCN